MYITIQSVPNRKHITSPLRSPTGYCCLGKQSLFIVRTTRNTQIHSVDRMQSFSVLKQVVHIVTTGLYRVIDDDTLVSLQYA
jgi:hypothetical protein